MEMIENSFNLIDEKWIPVASVGLCSIKDIFQMRGNSVLGGNPVQKISIIKLLLAIAQSAYTPEDEDEMFAIGVDGLADRCLSYLEAKHDLFYLYGEKPFLQIPQAIEAAVQPFGAVLLEVSTGNSTVLSQLNIEKPITDADKAMLVVQQMGFGLGGKKADKPNILSFSDDKQKKSSKPGTFLGNFGFLYSFFYGKSIIETIWLNLFTKPEIEDMSVFPNGVGIAPWESMPTTTDGPVAEDLKKSLMGRMVPVSRFILLGESGLHYADGIFHPEYREGGFDPAISIYRSEKNTKVLLVDPNKRPWRMLTSMLSFLSVSNSNSFNCAQLALHIERSRRHGVVDIWAGGLRVSSNSGEQYITGSNDFVESIIQIPPDILGSAWFSNLQGEMKILEEFSSIVYASCCGYFKALGADNSNLAGHASESFWNQCGSHFQSLITACDNGDTLSMRKKFARFATAAYEKHCPNTTARQMDEWVKCYPNFTKYLTEKL